MIVELNVTAPVASPLFPLVSIATSAPSVTGPVSVTELPVALSVVISPFSVIPSRAVIETVLIPFATVVPIAPTETGLAADTLVADVQLFVNLAGTPDAASNSPYADGEPFYYILMETAESGLTVDDITVNLTQFPAGILSTNDGGPQAEVSVVLPQDDEA